MSTQLLIVFGIFLAINLAFISITDVIIDKNLVQNSPNDKIKNKNALFLHLGSVFGAILPNIGFMLIVSDLQDLTTWSIFFFFGIFCLIPFIPIIFLLHFNKYQAINDYSNINLREIKFNKKYDKKTIKNIILICVFLFFAYADKLFEYPLEPWVLEQLDSAYLFSLFLIVLIVINAIGMVVATFFYKYDKIKILTFSTVAIGVLLTISPFFGIVFFFVILSIIQILVGFFLINLISLMIDLSKGSVMLFQIMAAFLVLASVVFIPLGTLLSNFIPTEQIIFSAGIIITLSVIPIFFIK
ncbi:MAG: hypothetical protein ACTSUT_07210 [Promethearchaeota archaeon]